MAVIHQSDLASWNRCPQAFMFDRQGQPRRQTSALAYGTLIHYCLETFERTRRAEGCTFTDAVEAAVQTFRHYWHPDHIGEITKPVDLWIGRQTYSGLLARGTEALREYAELTRMDDHELLATEFSFQVPIPDTWDEELNEPHVLAGTIDRLAVRHYKGVEFVAVDDFKSGKQYAQLRQNLQFSSYCLATTLPEFWVGWRGEDGFGEDRGRQYYERFQGASRRGTWINMQKIAIVDAGWRGPDDYKRFALAVEQIVASMRADIYPLRLDGEVCTFCEFRDICGGVGVPDSSHGAPGIPV